MNRETLRAIKFTLFSISAGIIQIGSFTLLNELSPLSESVSYLISLVLSVLWNFTFNRRYTFQSAGNVPKAMALVALYYCAFTPLSFWLEDTLVGMGWNEYVATALNMVINFVTEFLYDKFVVFRRDTDTNEAARRAQAAGRQDAAPENGGEQESAETMYIFRKLHPDEVPRMFQMILERIKWMDEKGIRQWNVTDYATAYPLDYYEEAQRMGEAFAVENTESHSISAAAILKEQDDRWESREEALYLHSFVSQIGEPGAGAAFLRLAVEYAKTQGKRYFRLDSAEDNTPLADYYASQGFLPVGKCSDGPYHGILREKKLV